MSAALNLNPGFHLSGYIQVALTVQLVNTYALTNDCDLNYIFSGEKGQKLIKATQFQVSKRFKLSLQITVCIVSGFLFYYILPLCLKPKQTYALWLKQE